MQTPNEVIATLLDRLDRFDDDYTREITENGQSYYDDSQAVIDAFRHMLQNYESTDQPS